MGTRDRLLRCGERRDGQSWKMMNPNQCRNLIKPNSSLTEVCTTAECPRQPSSYWNVSPWSQVKYWCKSHHILHSLASVYINILCEIEEYKINVCIYPLHWLLFFLQPQCIQNSINSDAFIQIFKKWNKSMMQT